MAQLLKRLEVKSVTPATRWINDDIKPIESARRTWNVWTFNNYWAISNTNISVYLTGSSLIALGLNWWQATIRRIKYVNLLQGIVTGTLLATICILLNSVPGGFYHIGFPVVNRYVWGMYGSQFVIVNRIFLSLVWYGFQAWVGAECFYVCLMALDPNIETHIPNHMPETTGMTTAQFVAYIIFNLLCLPVIWIHPHKLAKFFYVSSANVVIFMLALLIWALATMGPAGFGDTISNTSGESATMSVGWMMVYGIISTIGSIAAGILNQNDYSRFARRPRDAMIGQAFSFPIYQIACCMIGILVTAATQQRFGASLWNLPDIFTTLIQTGGARERAAGFFAGLALVLSQIAICVPGNALSGGFDLAATFPKYVNIRRGGYITAILSPIVNPWRLVNTSTVFLAVMSAYSVFLGPMVGLMIISYFVVHRQKINIPDLFQGDSSSIYWYTWGMNWRAFVAWIFGVVPSFPGFLASVGTTIIIPTGLQNLYLMCFLSGFCISGAVLALLHFIFPARKVQEFVGNASTPRELIEENKLRSDAEPEQYIIEGHKDDGEGGLGTREEVVVHGLVKKGGD